MIVVVGTCGGCGGEHRHRLPMDDPNSRRQGPPGVWYECSCGKRTWLKRQHGKAQDGQVAP